VKRYNNKPMKIIIPLFVLLAILGCSHPRENDVYRNKETMHRVKIADVGEGIEGINTLYKMKKILDSERSFTVIRFVTDSAITIKQYVYTFDLIPQPEGLYSVYRIYSTPYFLQTHVLENE